MQDDRTTVRVVGNGNVIADVIQIFTGPVPRPRVVVEPGESHIADEQAAALKRLVDEIVRIEAVRPAPRTYAGVWVALNRYMKVPSYRLIPVGKYAKAEGYLRRWLTRLTNSQEAVGRMRAEARQAQIEFIALTMSDGLGERVRAYIDRKFGVTQLDHLSESRLKQVYSYVAGLRRRKLTLEE